MRSLPWHPSQGTSIKQDAADKVDFPADDLLSDTRAWIESGRADCCPGRPAYRIEFPAASSADGRRQLLLCSHHFRTGRPGLERTAALAFDADGRLVAGFPADGTRGAQ